jgi:hypothetical protein
VCLLITKDSRAFAFEEYRLTSNVVIGRSECKGGKLHARDATGTMARTSRGGGERAAASVDALDNLNLDDMFAGDDMALLDGLDIDLDNMDDIAGMDDAKIEPLTAQMEMDDDSLPEDKIESPASKRRKPKRKTKAPFFFDDDDDEYVDDKKKKKRGAKAVPKKKGTTKKSPAPAPVPDSKQAPATTKTTKGKSRVSGAMPPPLARGNSTSTTASSVAAAGQFGGRQKRGPNAGLPMSKSSKNKASSVSSKSSTDTGLKLKSKASASATPVAIPPPPTQAAEPTLQQIQAMHAQNSYCGLLPSNTLFYPFMPTLPNEPSLKNRKLFPLMDRIYSSLMSHMSTTGKTANGVTRVGETEAIYQLLHDAFKEEKSATAPNVAQLPHDKTEIVGTAIGSLRRTISLFDKGKLAGDLYGVCALLKRQHDFLKQNSANMEKWCKDNFTEADYASVYTPLKASRKRKSPDAPAAAPLPPPSILASFEASLLRVKIVCAGFKDPKSSGPLMAQLPPLFLPQGMAVKENNIERAKPPTKPATKKRKLSTPTEPKPPPVVKAEPVIKEAPTYTQMKPGRRRKALAELISRVAKDIESKLLQRVDDGHVTIERQQSDMLKLSSEDEALTMNTSGMWQWVEKSGYFGTCGEEELHRRFNGIRSHVSEQHGRNAPSGVGQIFPGQKSQQVADESLVDRLQSLLVEEETEDSNGDDGDEDDKDDDDLYLDNSDSYPASPLADLSSLSLDERLFLHVRSVGLAESLILPESTSSRETVSQPADNGFRRDERNKFLPTSVDDLEDTIGAMETDLDKLAGLNNLRADFLESVASSNYLSPDECKRKADEDTSAIAKFQNLLKKTKEIKVKNGKPKALKNDANALPW